MHPVHKPPRDATVFKLGLYATSHCAHHVRACGYFMWWTGDAMIIGNRVVKE